MLAVKPPDLIAWLGNAAFGFLSASLGPAMVAGVRWRRANWQGALASMFIGGGLALVLYFMKTAKMIAPKLDTGAIAFLVSIVVMIVVSLMTSEQVRSALPDKKKAKAAEAIPTPDHS